MYLKFSPLLASVVCLSLLSACGNDGDDDNNDDTDNTPIAACTGLADGTPCGDSTATDCDAADTCYQGACVSNRFAAGTACGDATDSLCDSPDTCDGAGHCVPNYLDGVVCGDPTDTDCNPKDVCRRGVCEAHILPEGSPCGSQVSNDCSEPDTCNAVGECLSHDIAEGDPCGDDLANTECNPADICTAGVCVRNITTAGTACGDNTATECNAADTCDGLGECAANNAIAGTACGSADASQCNAPDTCDGTGGCSANTTENGVSCYDCSVGAGSCGACATGVCENKTPVVCVAPDSLQGSNAAGNNQRGNMFDLVATQNIVIRKFDASPMNNTTIEIYEKAGTWNGFANTPSAWRLIGSAATPYTGGFSAVEVPVDVEIRAGETHAFYVTSNTTSVAVNYTNGAAVGNVYSSNADLALLEGGGLDYPFTQGTGAVYQPRIWNGLIHYDRIGELDSLGEAYVDGTAQGVMFDVDSIAKTDVGGINVELTAGTHDVNVYFRRGTFVGHEASSTGWELVGAVGGVGPGSPGDLTRIALPERILLDAGETVSFYVAGSNATSLRTQTGNPVGAVAGTSADATMNYGSAITGSFGGAGDAAAVRAVIELTECAVQ